MSSEGLDQAAVRAAYDDVAATYATHLPDASVEAPVDVHLIEHFAAVVGEGGSVLDAGCGAGRMLPVLARLGLVPQGIDPSPGMLRQARALHPAFDVQEGDLRDLPFASGSFDAVFAWYSTIHSPNDQLPQILHEVRRVVRTGGHALFAFQSGTGIADASGAYRALGHPVTLHRVRRGLEEFCGTLTACGWQVVLRFERGAAPRAALREKDGQAIVMAGNSAPA